MLCCVVDIVVYRCDGDRCWLCRVVDIVVTVTGVGCVGYACCIQSVRYSVLRGHATADTGQ